MRIEDVVAKLEKYSKTTAYTEREAGRREAYEHALYLLEAVTPKEAEPRTITVEGINNTWVTDMPKLKGEYPRPMTTQEIEEARNEN